MPGPSISVVVSTLDRAFSLRILLAALEQQTYTNFEVIVVVGPTHDDTLAVLASYSGRVRVLRCDQANLSASRNIGSAAARGAIVAFVDDDAVPCATWLQQLAAVFVDPSVDATGGAVYLVHPAQPSVQHRLGITSSLAEMQNVGTADGVLPPDAQARFWAWRPMGANMAFRRDALMAIGGFDEFYEWVFDDADVAVRLALAGRHFRALDEAVVYHVPASSRNRIVRTFNGRWWVGSKATAYFAVRNGMEAGETARAIVRRVLTVVHSDWLLSAELRRGAKIAARQVWSMRIRGAMGVAQGVLAAMLRPRRLMSKVQRVTGPSIQPIERFHGLPGEHAIAVDPILGLQQVAKVGSTPLRVAVLASTYPVPDAQGKAGVPTHDMHRLVQDLFVLGHTVHVIAPGASAHVAFYDGAYVHRVPLPADLPAEGAAGALAGELAFSHAVYHEVRRLILNDAIQIVYLSDCGLDGLVTALSGTIPVVAGPWLNVPDTAPCTSTPDEAAARQVLRAALLRHVCGIAVLGQGDAPDGVTAGNGSHLEPALGLAEICRGCIIAEPAITGIPTMGNAAKHE